MGCSYLKRSGAGFGFTAQALCSRRLCGESRSVDVLPTNIVACYEQAERLVKLSG